MTPTEQDKELRLEIARKVYRKPTPSEIMIWGTPEAVIDEVYSEAPIVYEFASYITANRKRVALEAKIEVCDKYLGFRAASDTEHEAIQWLDFQRDELHAELKAQQEET